jgi:hypothetical protein
LMSVLGSCIISWASFKYSSLTIISILLVEMHEKN